MVHYQTNQYLREFTKRLESQPPASSFDEAYDQITNTLNQVEDEMTGIRYNPETWQTDGRMYPVQADRIKPVEGFPAVQVLKSRGNNTFVRDNGAIEIQTREGTIVFSKLGADGNGVWTP